jgi:methylmalonyl-CoA/ethylmalonyl-CoA epimerase
MLSVGYPLYGVGVFFRLVVLNIVQHLSKGVHLIGTGFGMKKERLRMPWVDGDKIEFRLTFEKAVFKHQVTAPQTEVICNLTLNAGGFYMRFAGGLQHHFGHNRCENLLKAGKVSEIRTKYAKGIKSVNMNKLEHIGIAVSNLEESNRLFARLLGVSHYKIEEVASEGVRTSFFKVGDIKIELLEATRPDSPIARFIEKRGEGIHHLAFATPDIEKEMLAKKEKGFQLLSETPKEGADDKMIAFMHPKSTNGVLVELCGDKNIQ